jgi:CHAT domain-containing protein
MRRSLKTSCIAIAFMCSLHASARAQQEFIDSIHSMLVDLDSSIQFPPINQVLRKYIPFCAGNSINDSLTTGLKQLISEDYIFSGGLQQSVSPHLIRKYAPFLIRLSECIAQNDNELNRPGNMLRVGLSMIFAVTGKENYTLFKQARRIIQQIPFNDSLSSARRLYFLAKTYTDHPDSCIFFYRQAILHNPKKNIEENLLYSKTLYALGAVCYSNNKRDMAFNLFRENLEIRRKMHGENSSIYAYWMIVTADQYAYLSKFGIAQELNFKALDVTERTIGVESSQYALCLNDIGEVYYRNGQYDKALPYAQRSLAIKRKIFGYDYFDNVVSLHNLATLYTRMGLYNEAIPLLQESMSIAKKYFGETLVYAFELHPLAEVYTYMGEYDKALPLYQRSIQIQQQLQKQEGGSGKDVYYPGVLHSIACLYTRLGQYDKAIEIFKQTLLIKREIYGELNAEYAKSLNSYGEACLLKGDQQKALSLQLQSISINKKLFGTTHPNIATGLYNLARLYYSQNNFAKAHEACAQALHLQKIIFRGTHPDVAASLDLLGDIMQQLNYDKDARQCYEQAFGLRKNMMTATHPSYISSLYNLGMINTKNGSFQNAARLFMEADSAALLHIQQSYSSLSEEAKLIYLHKAETQFNHLPSLLYLHKTDDPAIANRIYANALVLKSMVLFHQQQIYNSIRKSGDDETLQVYNQWRFNKALMGQQLQVPAASRISSFDSLADVTTQIEEQLSRISSSFRNTSFNVGISLNDIQHNLDHGEAAVEFIRFKLFRNNWTDSIIYAALILLPEQKNAIFIPLFEERQLKQLLRFSNNSGEAAVNYLYPPPNKETRVSTELYKLVWQPLQISLIGAHTIYYSPAGLLNKLSFAAIHAGNGKLLLDDYDLRQLLCTRSLALKDEKPVVFSSASIWGNIDYDTDSEAMVNDTLNAFASTFETNYPLRKWNALPYSKTEIENISLILRKKNIHCKNESQTTANEGTFKKMDGNCASILHIATHGFFLPSAIHQSNPMFRSGLLLAGSNKSWSGTSRQTNREDGVLTAYEISHLDLSNALLVTLSACETALGGIEDNEGVYGLQRGFKMAGVRQVLISLWTVPDKETTELMINFYNNLLLDHNVNKALQEAQLAMKKKKYPPYYWAAFVLTR